MPTALTVNGFRFFFYSNENKDPSHVHVEKGGGMAKIWIHPVVRPAYFHNFTANDQRVIMELVTKYKTVIIEKWNEHFR